jgi:malate-CoA ligase subunit beta
MVVKAQVLTGGRGKAGGVKLCRSKADAIEAAKKLLGSRLATYQSGPAGVAVNKS